MTPQEYNQARATLGLSNAQVAAWLGVNVRTCEKWAGGANKVPGPAVVAIRVALALRALERVDLVQVDGGFVYVPDFEGEWVAWSDIQPLLEMKKGGDRG